jgi:hypothetical protein
MEEEKVIFSEVQYAIKKWWFLYLPVASIPIILVLDLIGSLDFPNPSWGGVFMLLIFLSIASFIIWLLIVMRIETKINESGIDIKYYPKNYFSHSVFVSWQLIERAEVCTYSAIREYGGWGHRITHQGQAYTIGGNMGLRMVLKDGSTILIGTQDPDGMEAALQIRKQRIARGL